MNSPNPQNFKPKLPSQTRHLDTFVMARLRDQYKHQARYRRTELFTCHMIQASYITE